MTGAWRLLLLVPLIVALDARAQDEAPAEEPAPVEEAPAETPMEVVPAEEAPVEEAAPAEAPVEGAVAEEAPADEAPAEQVAEESSEESTEEEGEPWALYVGADLVKTTVSTSAADADSGMYRLRVGRRLADGIGAELHYGLDNGGDGAGEVSTDSYYGIFVVPTATALERVELAFPVGYARSEFKSLSLSSVAYGFNAEVPLQAFGEDYPDLRFGLGWMVYNQKSAARAYGLNFGIRYDFTADGFGNPFAGFGDFVGGLWPFGDDEEGEDGEGQE